MKIDLHKIKLSAIAEGYRDDPEQGVHGYGGLLNIRPAYQREFVYKGKQQKSVVQSVQRGFPINVMYWVVVPGGKYELIDGQQRTISLCRYIAGDFSVDGRYFSNLMADEKKPVQDYEMMVYICEGTPSEKIEWFETINIAGEKLTRQETLNAIFHGPFVSDARKWFSKPNCPAVGKAKRYLKGSPIRQEYLATALQWISCNRIEDYLGKHQHDPDAGHLWQHFSSVIDWVQRVFRDYRKEMQGVNWGELYRLHGDKDLDLVHIEKEVRRLMADEDVTKKTGIYPYVLGGDERLLSLRAFDRKMKLEAYGRQDERCAVCTSPFVIDDMEADHIEPWSKGGGTIASNCQMLCKKCHKAKTLAM